MIMTVESSSTCCKGFVGYSRSWDHTTLNVKVGKLSSAFGAFPLRYDDMVNPLLDQPLPYDYLLDQPSSNSAENYGLTPVTLYGLPAAEVDLSWRRVDTRFQVTNSSPYNPVGFFKPANTRNGLRAGATRSARDFAWGSRLIAAPGWTAPC